MNALERTAARIDILSARHQVLVGNVANGQTPGYQARDVDFASAFDSISKGAQPSARMALTHRDHLSVDRSAGGAEVKERQGAHQPSVDGSNVDLDEERANLAQNALNLEAQMRFATHYIRLKQTASS